MEAPRDEFRLMEKRIKNYGRAVMANQSNKSKRQKMKMNAGRDESETNFAWSEVLDVCHTDLPFRESSSDIPTAKLGSTEPFSGSDETNWSEVTHCKVFDLSSVSPGLYLVSGALSIEQQLYWATKAVEEYSTVEHNNLNNLHSIYDSQETENTSTETISKAPVKDIPSVEDLWVKSVDEEVPFETFSKLRWSCLGYHYDWTQRMYQKNLKSPFPPDLATLCTSIAHLTGLELTVEAAIVNYYPTTANMGGHLDDAEHTMEKPIISISIGCSALFLIGSMSRYTTPTPILVRSGDVIIMSGVSRYCYHGVPLILNNTFIPLTHTLSAQHTLTTPSTLSTHDISNTNKLVEYIHTHECSESTKHVVQYLQQARINMNVRQVRKNALEEDEWIDKNGTGATTTPYVYA